MEKDEKIKDLLEQKANLKVELMRVNQELKKLVDKK